jgi:hypothetical protein
MATRQQPKGDKDMPESNGSTMGVFIVDDGEDDMYVVVAHDPGDAVRVSADTLYDGDEQPLEEAKVHYVDDGRMMDYEDDDGNCWHAPCWALAKALGRSFLGAWAP